MILTLTSVNRQTIYDLNLMAYGTVDLHVKFATDNGVLNMNNVPPLPQLFNYDQTLVTDGKTNTYVYTTAI